MNSYFSVFNQFGTSYQDKDISQDKNIEFLIFMRIFSEKRSSFLMQQCSLSINATIRLLVKMCMDKIIAENEIKFNRLKNQALLEHALDNRFQ